MESGSSAVVDAVEDLGEQLCPIGLVVVGGVVALAAEDGDDT